MLLVAEADVAVLSLLRASVVVEPAALVVVVVGLVVVRDVVDGVVLAEAADVVGLVAEETVLVRAVGLFSAAAEPATLDRRSRVDVVGFVGALVEELPISDIRFAVPEIPLFSSPELATDLPFSSAELLTEARDR